MQIVIVGGGVAGLEALLGLRDVAPADVDITLVAADPDFTYRPLAVAEPFARGRARRVPLAQIAEDAGAALVLDRLEAVDDAAGELRLHATRPNVRYDAALIAAGARPVAGIEGALTWFPGGDDAVYGDLLRDIEEGYSKRLAIVIPPGAAWPLPAYELAAMTAGEARAMGQSHVEVTLVTPENAPLAVFGERASRAAGEEMERAGVSVVTGAVARRDGQALVLEPSGERLDVERVVAIPRLLGPAIEGLASDGEGFIQTGEDGRVVRTTRTWAAGDGIVSAVKFGGVATQQARVAVASIARFAGAEHVPDPGEPVLQGRLLIGGRTRRLRGEGAPLWSGQGKIAGEYLPRWLAERGIAEPVEQIEEAIEVNRPVRELAGDTRHLFELGRQYRIADPAIAALGRRMREARSR
jgi:sulfide:quinone oxidoreductase